MTQEWAVVPGSRSRSCKSPGLGPGLKATGQSGPGQKYAGKKIPPFREKNPAQSRDGPAIPGFYGTLIPLCPGKQFTFSIENSVGLTCVKNGASPHLSRHFLCPVGPGPGPGRSLRDEWDRDKFSRDCPAWLARGTSGTRIKNRGTLPSRPLPIPEMTLPETQI